MGLKSTSFRLDEDVWREFRKRYGKKAYSRMRELMSSDLKQ